MEHYNYWYHMRRFPDRNKLFLDPLLQGEKFGLRFWKDKSEYPWEVKYSLRITQGLDERNVVEKYIHECVDLLSVNSLYLQEGEVDGFAGHVLKISLLSNESSKPEIKHVYCNRNVDNSVAMKCTVQNGKKIIELIVNDSNVGIFHCIENDFSTYVVIHHSSRSADPLISRLPGPKSLQQLCRDKILQSVDKYILQTLKYNIATRLPIPKLLQTYVKQGVDDVLDPSSFAYWEWIQGITFITKCKIVENKNGRYGPTTGQYGIFPY